MDKSISKLNDFGVIKVWDFIDSLSPGWIVTDVIDKDVYGIKNVKFEDGDVVVDIGANVGIFSVYLALLFPNVKIFAIEPSLKNYEHLLDNIAENGVKNITAINMALTCDGRDVKIGVYESNTGGADIYSPAQESKYINECSSMLLDDFLVKNNIDKVKLLKCDVQGTEYEIFSLFNGWDKIEYFSCAVHPVPCGLYGKGYDQTDLTNLINSKLDVSKVIAFCD